MAVFAIDLAVFGLAWQQDVGDIDIPATSEYYGEWLDRDNDGTGCES